MVRRTSGDGQGEKALCFQGPAAVLLLQKLLCELWMIILVRAPCREHDRGYLATETRERCL